MITIIIGGIVPEGADQPGGLPKISSWGRN